MCPHRFTLQYEKENEQVHCRIQNDRYQESQNEYGGSGMSLLQAGIISHKPGKGKTYITDKGYPGEK